MGNSSDTDPVINEEIRESYRVRRAVRRQIKRLEALRPQLQAALEAEPSAATPSHKAFIEQARKTLGDSQRLTEMLAKVEKDQKSLTRGLRATGVTPIPIPRAAKKRAREEEQQADTSPPEDQADTSSSEEQPDTSPSEDHPDTSPAEVEPAAKRARTKAPQKTNGVGDASGYRKRGPRKREPSGGRQSARDRREDAGTG
jgi:hypothetical protein